MPLARYIRRIGLVATFALPAFVTAGCAGQHYAEALTPADRQMMNQAAQRSLEDNKVGEGLNWANQASGHLGTVTPFKTFQASSGRDCRRYQQTLTVAGETYRAEDTACRQQDGEWRSINRPGTAGYDSFRAAAYRDDYEDHYWYPHYPVGPYFLYGRYGFRHGHHRRHGHR
jgi:surface antigen